MAMDSKVMVNEIEEMDLRLEFIQSQRFKKVLLFDNAAPHREQVTTDKLGQLGYVHMPHPPYSLDISPCDYHYYLSLQDFLVGNVHMPHPPYSLDISPCDYHYYLSLQDFLVGRDTRTQAVLHNHIEQLINTRPKQFWKDGIRKLADR
ncbi:unnamed protein product [Heligmosomoides polygyrus]|uniref:Mariner Mos1 transposase n=1 Tax=Heligmosomoides polygyrus TaxID=6339 RepID=A0A183GLQ1_HELPZ|nr:unnamed protein product [Heligmosomoides polygyrus]